MTRSYFAVPLVLLAACGGADELKEDRSAAIAGAEVVGPGSISTDLNQTFPSIDPLTGDLWYSEYGDSFDEQTIRVARSTAEGWGAPEVASFSGEWGD